MNLFKRHKSEKKLNWDDISYKQFKLLSQIDDHLSDEEKTIEMMTIIYGLEVLDLTMAEFKVKLNALEFMKTPLDSHIPHKTYKIGKYKCRFDISPEHMTTSQYIDYTNFIKAKNSEAALAVFLIPEGYAYNEGYDIKEIIDGIENLPCLSVINMGNFMQRFLVAFMMIFQQSLRKKVKKNKTMTKDQKKVIMDQIDQMVLTVLE